MAPRRTRSQGLSSSTCEHRSGIISVPVAVEGVGGPFPPVTVPAEGTDIEGAVLVAVDRPPEENGVSSPRLGNKVWMDAQIIQDIGVQDGLVRQILAKLVSLDTLAILLPILEIERHVFSTPPERAALAVLLNRPVVRDKRNNVAVDHVFRNGDLGIAESHLTHHDDVVASRQPVKIGDIRDAVARKSLLNLASEADIESNFPHGSLLFCDRKSRFVPVGLTRC